MTETPKNPAGEPETSFEAAGESAGCWDDLQIGFSGSPKAKLDDRGRLKMPAEFKAFIEKKYGKDFNAFYITSREGLDAEIYPMPEWQLYQARIFKMPKGLPLRKKLMTSNALYGEYGPSRPPADVRGAAQSGLGQRGSQGIGRRRSVESEEPDRFAGEREEQSVHRAG
jgi:hypothetical protein